MNYSEYTQTINALVDSVYDELKRDDTQELSNVVHDTVDGHQWVIYYADAFELVSFVRQADFSEYVEAQYTVENVCEPTTDLDTLVTRVAYWVLYNIVYGAVQERLEEEEA